MKEAVRPLEALTERAMHSIPAENRCQVFKDSGPSEPNALTAISVLCASVMKKKKTNTEAQRSHAASETCSDFSVSLCLYG